MAKIHTLKITNYKGIQNFEHVFGLTNLVCLIGRGDSGKTTILEAISAVLSPSWNLPFYDTDFYNCEINNPIQIEVSLYDLPKELLQEKKYGLYVRGLDLKTNLIHDELKNEHEAILTIRLVVEKDLEPKWLVVNDREGQEHIEIRAIDRAALNVFLISDSIDRHFAWNKGNPLSSLLRQDNQTNDNNGVLMDAFRVAKETIDTNPFSHLENVANKIKKNATELGVDITNAKTMIDLKDISTKDGKICLHENKIPFKLKGKGTKRLISIAIQIELVRSGGIILIDEIEQGLEPDRAKHLVSTLLKYQKFGQIFITTHSRDVLVELQAENVFLNKKDGKNLMQLDSDFQGCVRKNPEAFYSRKILICEGATEVGICKGINKFRIEQGKPSFSILGIGIVDGTGANFIKYCETFKNAGFDICAFCDSDDSAINKKKEDLKLMKINIVDCDVDFSIEKQLFNDLPWDSVNKLIDYAIEIKCKQFVEDSVKKQNANQLTDNWRDIDSSEIRLVLGSASTLKEKKKDGIEDKSWFKRTDHGIFLGETWCKALPRLKDKKLGKQFTALSDWIDNV